MKNPRYELICKVSSQSQKGDSFVYVDLGDEKCEPMFAVELVHEKIEPNFWHPVDDQHFRSSGDVQKFNDYENLILALAQTYKYEHHIVAPFVSALFEGEGREIFGIQNDEGFALTLDAGSCFGAMFDDPESAVLDYQIKKKIPVIDWHHELRMLKDPRISRYPHVWTISRFGEVFFNDLGEAFRKVKLKNPTNKPDYITEAYPSSEAIARARARVSPPKNDTQTNAAIELKEELKNGGKKGKASQRSAGDNSIGTRGKQNTRRTR